MKLKQLIELANNLYDLIVMIGCMVLSISVITGYIPSDNFFKVIVVFLLAHTTIIAIALQYKYDKRHDT